MFVAGIDCKLGDNVDFVVGDEFLGIHLMLAWLGQVCGGGKEEIVDV